MAENQAGSPDRGFRPETFKAGLSTLCEQYKNTWNVSPIGVSRGPFKILGIARQHLSEEQLAAERPEEEARQKLVDFAALGIVSALKTRQAKEALTEVQEQLKRLEQGSIPNYAPDLLQEIFERTLLEIQSTEEKSVPQE